MKFTDAGFLVLCAAAFLGALDGAVNVAFPTIVSSFDISEPEIRWIVISFILAVASFTIVFGRMGDLFGHKRVFIAGLALSVLSYSLCAIAPSYKLLVAFRFLQGVSQGLTVSCIVALMTLNLPPDQKRAAIGTMVTVTGVGMASGPLFGGVLVAEFGWSVVFWARAILAVGLLSLTSFVKAPAWNATRKIAFDWIGALCIFALVAAIIGVSLVANADRFAALLVLLLVAFVAYLGRAFVRHERRHPNPVLDMEHFSRPGLTGLQSAAVVINFCFFSILLLLPFALVKGTALGHGMSGVMLALAPLGTVLTGLLVRRVFSHVPSHVMTVGGLFVVSIALAFLGIFGLNSGLLFMGVALILVGIGIGLFKTGCIDITTSLLPLEQRGVAGGLYNVTQVLGFVLGASFLTLLAGWFRDGTGDGSEYAMVFISVGMGLGVFGVLFSIFDRRARKSLP